MFEISRLKVLVRDDANAAGTHPGNGGFRRGVSYLPVPCKGTWLMKRCGLSQVLLAVWMGRPDHPGGLHPGTGPGWQQG